MKIEPHCYQACERSDRRSEPSQVDAKQKSGPIGSEFRKQNGGGNIAYDLACCEGNGKGSRVHGRPKRCLDKGDGRHISREDEKAKERCKQSVIDFSIYVSVE